MMQTYRTARHGSMRLALVVLLGAAAFVLWFLLSPPHPITPSRLQAPPPDEPKPTPGLPWFVDVARARGIDFQHYDPATPMHYIQETMGSGIGWIDYDNDGWLDLFVVQDGPVRPLAGAAYPTSKLYRNNGDGTFTDVTAACGLARPGFGMGVAVGDYDNDGYDDLLVTYLGEIVLYHNEPDGKGGRCFADVTRRAGLRNPHWGTSAAWGDVDGDGLLDLYICNYVEVNLDHYPDCSEPGKSVRGSCPPTVFAYTPHRLYRNNGDGTFTDISESSGVAGVSASPGLGVVMTDVDGDGKLDIYVANDKKPAYLFHNQGGGKFVEKALLSGCGLGPSGTLVAGMGVEAGDVDGSGRPSLFVTNFQNLPNVLYVNKGNLIFTERSNPSGLGPPSILRLGFGTVFFDADLDGHLDVAVANGHIHRTALELIGIPCAQEAQLFLGDGNGRFRDLSAAAGLYFREPRIGRGLAWADFDNDGKPDLAFSNNAGTIALLHNRTETTNHWIRLELIGDGKKVNRNAVGSRVEIDTGEYKLVRFVNGGGSYLSASDRRLLVGLGKSDRAARVALTWPDGRKQEFKDLPGKRWWRLQYGSEQPQEVTRKR